MKLADKLLIAASILALAWAMFVVSMVPLGVADQIYHPIREALLIAHTDDQAKDFAGNMGGLAGRTFQSAAWFALGPVLAVNGGWCVLAIYRMGRRIAKSDAG
jgi:hypothetical protein